MIAELMNRTGIRLSSDDPAFVIVELNRLSIEQVLTQASTRLDAIAPAIETAARKAAVDITRASLGGISAETTMARATLAAEGEQAIERVKLAALVAQRAEAEAIERLAQSERSASRRLISLLAGTVALLLSIGIFGAGVWVGQAGLPVAAAQGR